MQFFDLWKRSLNNLGICVTYSVLLFGIQITKYHSSHSRSIYLSVFVCSTVYEYKSATRLRHEEEVSQTEFSGSKKKPLTDP